MDMKKGFNVDFHLKVNENSKLSSLGEPWYEIFGIYNTNVLIFISGRS